jgi:Transcriptional regulator PadR-like family
MPDSSLGQRGSATTIWVGRQGHHLKQLPATDSPGVLQSAAMSATRLLVIGVVRLFQRVHGYSVRRELLSWKVEDWAHVNPGSIYNALRTLTREGYLEEAGTATEGSRPERTLYQLTLDGESE